jgi:hypothetical protein
MGIETLTSAARAAGFAMAPSEELLMPAARRTGEVSSSPPRTADAPTVDKARPVERKQTIVSAWAGALWWPFWKTA